jgi:archaellum component FlaC
MINLTAKLSELSKDLAETQHKLTHKEGKLAELPAVFDFDDDYRKVLEDDIQKLEDHIDVVENSIEDIEAELEQLSNPYSGNGDEW